MLAPDAFLQGRYRIIRQLSRGGMGAVYEATDERLDRPVAVKELLVEGDELRRAFGREARLLANLTHPALPRVTDHFTEGEGHFLVMDFIPGDDLKQMTESRAAPFPVETVLRWAVQLLDALEYLHSHEPPVIHRDVKPANLKLLKDGRVVLLDFGLAKGGAAHTQATTSRSVFGYSPHFASLEQMQGERSTARSDLYSFSATLYYLLTRRVPPDSLTRAAAVFNEEPDQLLPIRSINPEVPEAVARIIISGLELRTSARPANAAAMRAQLTAIHPKGGTPDDEATQVAQRSETPASARPSISKSPRSRERPAETLIESPEGESMPVGGPPRSGQFASSKHGRKSSTAFRPLTILGASLLTVGVTLGVIYLVEFAGIPFGQSGPSGDAGAEGARPAASSVLAESGHAAPNTNANSAASPTASQTPTPSPTPIDENVAWEDFYPRFVSAINRRDKKALLQMMPRDFFDGGGGMTPREWLDFIDENAAEGSWKDLQRSFRQGTRVDRNWSGKGLAMRVTRDNGYYFEFRKDKRWYFAGVMGD